MRVWKLEIKKILKTRRTQILIALSLFLAVWMAYLPVTFEKLTIYDETGKKTEVEGREAISQLKTLQKDITGAVTPEKVRMSLEAYQACLREYGVEGSYDLPDGVYEQRILPYAPLASGTREVFANRENGIAPAYLDIKPEWIDDYYGACEERLVSLMRMEQKDNQAAQDMAVRMYQNVEKPYHYYPGYNSNAAEYEAFLEMFVLLFAICIAAPVFSSDYQTGADDILRCTKHGRIKLGLAKFFTAVSVTGVLYVVCMTIYLLLSNSFFGWECTKTSIQIEWSITNLVNWNMGELQCAVAAAGFLTILASVCFTLFLSSRCKNVVSSLAIGFIVSLLPLFLYLMLDAASKIGQWLTCLLPSGGVCPPNGFLYEVMDYKFLKFGNLALWTPYAMLYFAGIEIALFAVLALSSYTRHRVR